MHHTYYLPKKVKGMVKGTGWPIDGHALYLTLWDYDNYRWYHLSDWAEADEEAVMKTMYQTEYEAGMCLVDTLEEFEKQWKSDEWESRGSFCIPLENVEILEVIHEEDKDWKPKRQQKETKACSGECDLCPEAEGCEQCGSV